MFWKQFFLVLQMLSECSLNILKQIVMFKKPLDDYPTKTFREPS